MDKVDVFEELKYCWDCPNCGEYNVSDTGRTIYCEHCGEDFAIGHVSR